MCSRKEHLFKKNNRYAKNVKNVLVAGEKKKRQIIKIIIIKIIYIYMQRNCFCNCNCSFRYS